MDDDEYEDDQYDTDDFDDDDYQEFIDREFGDGRAPGHRPIWVITAVVLLLAMALALVGQVLT